MINQRLHKKIGFAPPIGPAVGMAGGSSCATDNDGDGSVIYDPIADRWMLSQFAVTAGGTTGPFYECIAVSQTADPTGAWNRYAYSFPGFPDYPKVAVWPDAYYVTFAVFNAAGTAFLGPKVCAFDRTRMLAGLSATSQCFNGANTIGIMLAADVDGMTAPPAGSAEPVLALGAAANTLAYYKFHVDWTTPANSTLTGPTNLGVNAFSDACAPSGSCIRQNGSPTQLDSLGDRLMHRLAYRNFGDHEAL